MKDNRHITHFDIIAILVITIIYKKSKTSVKINLYRKVSSKNWGVSF